MTRRAVHNVVRGLERLLVPIGELVPDPRNARRHDERNIAAIAASLSRFGQHVPLVVSAADGVVRVGNGRLAAARSLGWTHVAAVRVAESEVESVGRAIADNRTAELSEWDVEALEKTLCALERAGVDLVALGWSEDELRGMTQGFPESPARARTGQAGAEERGEVALIFPVGETERALAIARTALGGFQGVEIAAADNVVEE